MSDLVNAITSIKVKRKEYRLPKTKFGGKD